MGRNKRRGASVKLKESKVAVNTSLLRDVAISLAVLVIAAIPFCYGKYIEFNTNDPYDGALNIYSAKCVADGQKVSVDVFPSARPATLLVNIIGVTLFGFSEFGPKLIQLLMQAGALSLMYYTVRKLYGILPAAVSVIMAAFYLSCPPFAKFGNVKEQFMIACLIITACTFILNHIGGKWWLLLISGAAGINIYYFKPTGVSVLIAIMIFVLTQSFLKRRTFKRLGTDVVLLMAGAIVGLSPLMMFYLWQGKFFSFMGQFPASIVKLGIFGFVAYVLVHLGYRLAVKLGGSTVERKVRLIPWKSIILVTVVVIVALVMLLLLGSWDVVNKIRHLPVIGRPVKAVVRVLLPVRMIIRQVDSGSKTGYLAGTRSVSVFSAQFVKVMRNYRSFVAPIGLSLLAIVWWLGGVFVSIRKKPKIPDPESDGHQAEVNVDKFVLLLTIWWVLDMLFVWVSPRNYVQYYLPLNASAAMLAGYAIYKCKQKPWGFCCVLAAWLLVDMFLVWAAPKEGFPFIGIKTAEAVGKYWPVFFGRLAIVGVGYGIWFAGKRTKLTSVTTVLLILLCAGMWFNFNSVNLKTFSARAKAASESAVPSWEQLSHYIRDNSASDDGLYVWGWLPGIYVQSQRSTPATRLVAYSDMHADPPEEVERKIERLVKELTAHPPKYIVDSQKIHFPYYDHPVFDLWPSWQDRSKGWVHMRFFPSQVFSYNNALTPEEVKRFKDRVLDDVENRTKMILSDSRRQGGAVAKDRAGKMAHDERLRHQAMLPLRDFVVNNYEIVPINAGGHVLFKRKTGGSR